ncbi:MAG: hypothetical protein AAGM67_13875, partial [Bacteroidota bacterium]
MRYTKHSFLALGLLLYIAGLNAQLVQYPWPASSDLVNDSKYELRARTYDLATRTYGNWMDLTVFLSTQRSYPTHW